MPAAYNIYTDEDLIVLMSQGDEAAFTEIYPQWQAGQSFPLIRYAEVLLTYAEDQNEATGPDASVYAALDSIAQPRTWQATFAKLPYP